MRKPRIFYLITRSEPGGAQSHVLELINGLKQDYEITLGTGETGFLLDEAKNAGVETIYLPSLKRNISPLNEYKAYREILASLKNVQPDLLHCHSSKAGILGRLAARKLDIPCVFTAHGWAFTEGTPFGKKTLAIFLEWLLARWTDRIITVSEVDRKLALRYRISNAKKLVTIHNGISNKTPEHNRDSNSPVTIIMVARFAPQKNFSLLLDAVSVIDESYRLLLVGDGPQLEEMRQKADKLGISDKVSFMGSRNDVDHLLNSSDLFVLSTNWEGLPISILEAMRSGLPVIATDVGGISEAVQHKISGILVARGDINELRDAIKLLLNHPGTRQTMSSNAREIFLRSFTSDVMLSRIKNEYTQLGCSPL